MISAQGLCILTKASINSEDFEWMISTDARPYLEEMAQRAHTTSLRQFGKTVQLYTPLYLSNYCDNLCIYCGFHKGAPILRHQLDLENITRELKALYATGIREVLLLTGEAPQTTPLHYIANAAREAKRIGFKSVGIEVYPMSTDAYKELVAAGANSLTVYQETYNRTRYAQVHLKGPKADYDFRYNAPARAAAAGFKQIAIGALYGLSEPREDALATFRHLRTLEKEYPYIEWGIAVPRLREATKWGQLEGVPLDDSDFVQLFLAFRIAFERASMSLSTRESASLRRNMLPFGVNKLSAGVLTTVGGYAARAESDACSPAQFAISDDSSVLETVHLLINAGYQPIFCDWLDVLHDHDERRG